MKKICTFILALTATTLLNAQSFGILVNGSKYFAGELNTAQTGWTEYMITGVPLAAGDQCVIYDLGNQAGWAEPLDEASTSNLTLNGSSYSVSVAGCYDFYLKMFGFENNQLYVGYAGESGCSDYSTTIGDNPGGQGGQTGQLYYYLKESGMGSPSADELFENGVLANYNAVATDASGKCYFFLIISNTEGSAIGQQYMTKAYVDGGTSAQFFPDGVSNYEKWGLAPGTYTFYLYKDEGDSYTISLEPIPGRTVVDAQGDDSAVENVYQLDTNAPMFNILGVPVDENYQGIIIQNGHKFMR